VDIFEAEAALNRPALALETSSALGPAFALLVGAASVLKLAASEAADDGRFNDAFALANVARAAGNGAGSLIGRDKVVAVTAQTTAVDLDGGVATPSVGGAGGCSPPLNS
jgi:hypothetical protein